LVDDIRLVASELATNAMVHARTPFVVSLSELNGVVLLAVRDGSTSVPVKARPQVIGLGGRGLVLVELLSHEWGARTDASGYRSVWAPFITRARPRRAPLLT
jgi:anti-sigma regulatory factor (Ser/Thr protein kinase)